MSLFHRTAATLSLLVAAAAAAAAPVTYDFSLNINSGPLLGQSYSGSFTYDSSSVSAGNQVDAAALLTDFSFTFDSVSYTAANANTGWLGFDTNGELIDFGIGNHCAAGSCAATPGTNDWFMTSFAFFYAQPGDAGQYFSDAPNFSLHPSSGNIPEPTSLALVLAACLATTLRRRA